MLRFIDLPIRRKIVIIILAGMGVSMSVALTNFILFDRLSTKNRLVEEMTILARITAARSGAALAFGDHRKAEENLAQLHIRQSIQVACIYARDGALFAAYERNPENGLRCSRQLPDLDTPMADHLVVGDVVSNKSGRLGEILVISDLSEVNARVVNWLLLSVLMAAIAVSVALLMTRRMQKSIVNPIQRITEVMDEVRETNNLALRAYPAGRDELGDLVDAFNEMLAIIENSNLDLEIVYSELVNKSTKAEATAVELEARNEQIKEMLSGAAHDLRQPLQAMAIFVDLLELQVNTDKQRSLVEKLQAAQANLQGLFTEILDVSRLDHQEGTAEIQRVNIVQLFDKLQLEFGALARKKQLELRVRLNATEVNTIPGILERIIRNLVSNALNYTDAGGVLLATRYRQGGIALEVWDTGRGIPEKKREKIFQKYERVEGGKEGGKEAGRDGGIESGKERSGYGLGLAIVRQFVDILGYRLTVRSEEGCGSCFRIFIPDLDREQSMDSHGDKRNRHFDESVTVVDSSRREGATEPGHPIASEQRQSGNYLEVLESLLRTNIFLVDDDPQMREALTLLLQSWDIHVLAFASLEELEHYFDSGDFIDPDLIISDYQLGQGATGDQAIEEIRLAVGVEVPAFVVTGNQSADIHHEINARGYEFLLKPVDAELLKSTIERYLSEPL